MKRILIIIVAAVVAASCSSLDRYNGKSPAMLTAAPQAPPGLLRAIIIEVDGTSVRTGARRIRLAAGPHTVKVWPLQYGAWDERQKFEQLRIADLEFNAAPGQQYSLAARQRRFRTAVNSTKGANLVESPWQTVIIPEIVNTIEPTEAIHIAASH